MSATKGIDAIEKISSRAKGPGGLRLRAVCVEDTTVEKASFLKP